MPTGSWRRRPGPTASGKCRRSSSSARTRGRSLTLIRAGTWSLRAELDHLLLLTTLYGPAPVEAALGACLAQAIVGSDHVEQWLRLQTQGPVAPPPLTLGDPRLALPPVRPNLARYDALLLAAGDAPVDAEGDADGQPVA